MASKQYIYIPPTIINAIGGDPKTGSKWGAGFVANDAERHNAVLAQIAGDMNFVLSLLGVTSTDTLTYSWASNDAIIVHPGLAIAADGTQHQVVNDTTLSLDADLDTGTRQADSIYFVWIGQDTISGDTKLKLSLSYDTPPTSLVSGSAYRLKNFFNTTPTNSNIEQFIEALPDDWPAGIYFHDAPYKPAGCHWAHGQLVSRSHAAYNRLFAKFGDVWGAGDGSTTFGLPDTRGRSPMGAGQGVDLSLRLLAQYFGVEGVELVEGQLPPHTHIVPAHNHTGGAHTHIGGAHTHTYYRMYNTGYTASYGGTGKIAYGGSTTEAGGAVATSSAGNVATTTQPATNTQSAGNGDAHDNIHPVFVGHYILKG